LVAFSQFASDLDDATRKQLERGQRVTEVLKQSQYLPMSVAEISIVLFSANVGYLDNIALDKVLSFETNLLDYAKLNNSELISEINSKCEYNKEVEKSLFNLLDNFVSSTSV
jgi:F-type H+-transporting ATPase subunit alpha